MSRTAVSVEALSGERISSASFGSEHVSGGKYSCITLLTESGRELVISQCFGELQLTEVDSPKRAVPATAEKPPSARKRRCGAVKTARS